MAAVGLGFLFLFYSQTIPDDYAPADDEIAVHIQFDTREDIGLLVYDYCADGHEYSGGTSNADGSLIGHEMCIRDRSMMQSQLLFLIFEKTSCLLAGVKSSLPG